MTIAEALRGVTRIGLDSSAFIDYGEAAPPSIKALTRIFDRLDAGTLTGVASTLVLTEVLAYARGKSVTPGVTSVADAEAEEKHGALLAVVQLVPVSESVARLAADLRGRYGLRTPDAVHLASALEAGAQAFVTSDAADFLRASGEIRVIVPDRLTG